MIPLYSAINSLEAENKKLKSENIKLKEENAVLLASVTSLIELMLKEKS